MTKESIENYRDIYKTGLLEDILPFWMKYGIDWKDGGYSLCLDRDGKTVNPC